MNTSSSTTANSKLKELFLEQLCDIYWAEKKLYKAIGKMSSATAHEQLSQAFNTHQQQTEIHISRLEQVFSLLDEPAKATKCPAMAGIISEAEDLIDDTESNTAERDVALILAAQKAEHYEIASYGSLAQLAKTLGLEQVKNLFGQTLEEEKQTDLLLTKIAEGGINQEASTEPAHSGL